MNLLRYLISQGVFRDIHIIAGLQVQPVTRALAKIFTKAQGALCIYRPFPVINVINLFVY